jgi:hypothetical protein
MDAQRKTYSLIKQIKLRIGIFPLLSDLLVSHDWNSDPPRECDAPPPSQFLAWGRGPAAERNTCAGESPAALARWAAAGGHAARGAKSREWGSGAAARQPAIACRS